MLSKSHFPPFFTWISRRIAKAKNSNFPSLIRCQTQINTKMFYPIEMEIQNFYFFCATTHTPLGKTVPSTSQITLMTLFSPYFYLPSWKWKTRRVKRRKYFIDWIFHEFFMANKRKWKKAILFFFLSCSFIFYLHFMYTAITPLH